MSDPSKNDPWSDLFEGVWEKAEKPEPDAKRLAESRQKLLAFARETLADPALEMREAELAPAGDLGWLINLRRGGAEAELIQKNPHFGEWRLVPTDVDRVMTDDGPVHPLPTSAVARCYPDAVGDAGFGVRLTLRMTTLPGTSLATPTLTLSPPPQCDALRVLVQFTDGLERSFIFAAPEIDAMEQTTPAGDPLPLSSLGGDNASEPELVPFGIQFRGRRALAEEIAFIAHQREALLGAEVPLQHTLTMTNLSVSYVNWSIFLVRAVSPEAA